MFAAVIGCMRAFDGTGHLPVHDIRDPVSIHPYRANRRPPRSPDTAVVGTMTGHRRLRKSLREYATNSGVR
ncbi:MAG: hypothetical protein QHI48_10730 [Bacteroidota bacterium]|nr:hypothetical protein [Bacteroidota bacterium]